MAEKKLVYITGSGHSGSTLLDLLLNGHNQITGLGEVHRFSLSFSHDIEPLNCSCGYRITSCPFWKRVIRNIIDEQLVSGNNMNNFITTTARLDPDNVDSKYLSADSKKPLYVFSINRLAMLIGSKRFWRLLSIISKDVSRNIKALTNSMVIFEIVRKINNTPIIIDSTKNPTRLKGFQLMNNDSLFIIHLIRDGRAVCYSRMKRENISMEESAKIWVSEQLKIDIILSRVKESNLIKVSYEELCNNTTNVLKEICSFLGINFQSSMLNFRDNESHSLGGNPMRFVQNDHNIILREGWKGELTTDDKYVFSKIAGRINKKYGYI